MDQAKTSAVTKLAAAIERRDRLTTTAQRAIEEASLAGLKVSEAEAELDALYSELDALYDDRATVDTEHEDDKVNRPHLYWCKDTRPKVQCTDGYLRRFYRSHRYRWAAQRLGVGLVPSHRCPVPEGQPDNVGIWLADDEVVPCRSYRKGFKETEVEPPFSL